MAFLLVVLLVFGPIILLVRYGYKRGKRAFAERLAEVDNALTVRNSVLAKSFKAAIIPALVSLLGGIRARVTRGHENNEEMIWQIVIALAVMLITLVIIPFVIGVQVAYAKATKAHP